MEYVRTFTQELEVGEAVELSVENRSGTVTVRGEKTARVRIEVVARLWAESSAEADEQADLIQRGIRQEGKRVLIRAPTLLRPGPFLFFARSPRIDYQVSTPTATNATIDSRSGRVEVESIAGPLEIAARSGRVTLKNVGGDVSVSSRSGSVQAESIAGMLAVVSRSGGLRVSGCAGDVTVEARSGSMQIEGVRGSLKIEGRSGMVSIADAGGALTVRTRSGAVRYEGGVHGPFDIDIASGSVRLALDPDSRFFLDAESMSGAVLSDLPLRRRGGPPATENAPSMRVRTRSGSIHLTTR